MTDLINVMVNDPLLMDAVSEQTGFASGMLVPLERGVLSDKKRYVV